MNSDATAVAETDFNEAHDYFLDDSIEVVVAAASDGDAFCNDFSYS